MITIPFSTSAWLWTSPAGYAGLLGEQQRGTFHQARVNAAGDVLSYDRGLY